MAMVRMVVNLRKSMAFGSTLSYRTDVSEHAKTDAAHLILITLRIAFVIAYTHNFRWHLPPTPR